jgi:hypothetical protein
MAKIAQSISFGISDRDIDPRTGEKYPEGKQCYSVNSPPWEDAEENSRIWLAYQAILPIMEDDIPQKIRLAYQFDLALILLREFAVSNLSSNKYYSQAFLGIPDFLSCTPESFS